MYQILKIILRLAKNPQIILDNRGYIFILSHMRSRSTLLAHILGSNPEIGGYFELHKSYLNWLDLIILRLRVQLDNKNIKFALDKILWNRLQISEKICLKENLKIIFLLRKPEDTIKSIINMGNCLGNQGYKNYQWITNYYCSRLENLIYYSSKIRPQNGLFIESDKIIQDTDHVLSYLSTWLGLSKRLNSHYLLFKKTGVRGMGDPLNNITKGKIIKKNIRI